MEGSPDTHFQALCIAAIELVVNVGIMDSISDRWPDEVKDNWDARMENLTERMQQETEEIQQFGVAFD